MEKHFFSLLASGVIFSIQVTLLQGETADGPKVIPARDNVRFVGDINCKSSMCHGGASPSRDQFTIWTRDDFHSRAYATLVTARSARIAESLGIANAANDARCTVCHAPMACPGVALAPTANPTEGVSCENCHGAASFWLRGHTRTDWTYLDRLHAGMRDLRSAYVRAETCVTCHQVIDPALLKAGHPELTFELDGQTASEPRHWTEKADWFGPQAWLVGQAVALSKISTDIHSDGRLDLKPEQNALFWLLQQIPGVKADNVTTDREPVVAVWSNELAQSFSENAWSTAATQQTLAALTNTSSSFTDNHVPRDECELRAERLVLGLDRLFKALHGNSSAPGSVELSALFDAVQDRERFDPQAFAAELQKFAAAIKPGSP
jgi:hypothetical protein